MNDNAPHTDEKILILHDKIVERIRTVYDPEIPVNLFDLGLIYRIAIDPVEGKETYNLTIDMTLTSVGCPLADQMPGMVHRSVADLPELNEVMVNLVWDPPWDKSRMTDEARMILNIV